MKVGATIRLSPTIEFFMVIVVALALWVSPSLFSFPKAEPEQEV
jgi:hypothetical protein